MCVSGGGSRESSRERDLVSLDAIVEEFDALLVDKLDVGLRVILGTKVAAGSRRQNKDKGKRGEEEHQRSRTRQGKDRGKRGEEGGLTGWT